jgi:hypothetical protein
VDDGNALPSELNPLPACIDVVGEMPLSEFSASRMGVALHRLHSRAVVLRHAYQTHGYVRSEMRTLVSLFTASTGDVVSSQLVQRCIQMHHSGAQCSLTGGYQRRRLLGGSGSKRDLPNMSSSPSAMSQVAKVPSEGSIRR